MPTSHRTLPITATPLFTKWNTPTFAIAPNNGVPRYVGHNIQHNNITTHRKAYFTIKDQCYFEHLSVKFKQEKTKSAVVKEISIWQTRLMYATG